MTTTNAVIYIPIRAVSGRFASNLASSTKKNLKSWKPSVNAPMVDDQGRITPPWNQFINYLIETVLGGANAVTLADIAGFATVGQVQAIANNAAIGALKQQGTNNAQVIDAIRQVTVTAALVGAAQIPPVQLTNDSGG